MRTLNIATACALAFAALGCAIGVGVAKAQEGRGGSGNASSWQAGSARAAVPSAHSVSTGGSSIWTAGQGSSTMRSQPGGVWSDGSTLRAASQPPTARSTAQENAVGRPSSAIRLGTAPSHRAAPRTTQASSQSSTAHLSGGPHASGVAHRAFGGVSGARNASSHRGSAGAHKSKSGLQSGRGGMPAGLNSGPVSPMQSSSALPSLTPALPSESLGLSLHPPGGATH